MDSEFRNEDGNADSSPEREGVEVPALFSNRRFRRALKAEAKRQQRRTMRALHRELKTMRIQAGVAPWRTEEDTSPEELVNESSERQPDSGESDHASRPAPGNE